MDMNLHFRYAQRKDVSLILRFIQELAEYEKMLNEVVCDEETLEEWIFDKEKAENQVQKMIDKYGFHIRASQKVSELSVGEQQKVEILKAIYRNANLEDLYVSPEYRGNGYGKAILKKLAAIAVERKCGRLEWWCLDWNKSSIDFYLSLSAEPMSDWTVYRIAGETLNKLAK